MIPLISVLFSPGYYHLCKRSLHHFAGLVFCEAECTTVCNTSSLLSALVCSRIPLHMWRQEVPSLESCLRRSVVLIIPVVIRDCHCAHIQMLALYTAAHQGIPLLFPSKCCCSSSSCWAVIPHCAKLPTVCAQTKSKDFSIRGKQSCCFLIYKESPERALHTCCFVLKECQMALLVDLIWNTSIPLKEIRAWYFTKDILPLGRLFHVGDKLKWAPLSVLIISSNFK